MFMWSYLVAWNELDEHLTYLCDFVKYLVDCAKWMCCLFSISVCFKKKMNKAKVKTFLLAGAFIYTHIYRCLDS